MSAFKEWFDQNKQDATNLYHELAGVTCELAKGKRIWVSHNPGVESSYCVSDHLKGWPLILSDGTFEQAEALWLEHEKPSKK